MEYLKKLLPWLVGLLIVVLVFTLFDERGAGLEGWGAYLAMALLSGGLAILAWLSIRQLNPPGWLLVALAVAICLRLGMSLLATNLLPEFGYDTKIQRVGHIYRDSYERDEQSLALARSGDPLIESFTEPAQSDQYGGLFFLWAATYRYLTPESHLPLVITILTSVMGAIALLYTWAFSTLTFGERPAQIAAWLVVFFPEAVLLSAAQMREPFLMTAFALALYGYALLRESKNMAGFAAIGFSVFILGLPMSPPFAFILVITLGLAWLWEGQGLSTRTILVLGGIVVFSVIVLVLAAQAWEAGAAVTGSAANVLVQWWENAAGEWRFNLLAERSDMADSIMAIAPSWAHLPMIVAYGLVQPFLPASIAAPGAPFWWIIAIYRSLGWFFMLPFLLYAPMAALRARGWRSLIFYLSIFVWATAILASYRTPGYQWDNPRYRAIFLAAQAAIVGWSWVHARSIHSPWLLHAGVLVGGSSLIILIWYLGRYTALPAIGLLPTLFVLILFAGIYLAVAVWRDFVRKPKVES